MEKCGQKGAMGFAAYEHRGIWCPGSPASDSEGGVKSTEVSSCLGASFALHPGNWAQGPPGDSRCAHTPLVWDFRAGNIEHI